MLSLKKAPLKAVLLILSALMGLNACSKPADSNPVEPATPRNISSVEPESVTVSATEPSSVTIGSLLPSQAYDCLPAQNITATYDRQNTADVQVMLEINGMIHVLYAKSMMDSLYRSDSGLIEGEGMTWQVQADTATLSSVLPNSHGTPSERILFRCTPLGRLSSGD